MALTLGSRVKVFLKDGTILHGATVVHIPSSPNEDWIIKEADGKESYIRDYDRIAED